MEEITSIHDIDAILEKTTEKAYALDVAYLTKRIKIHDGIIVICCPAIKEEIEKGTYFLSYKNFNQWTEANKNWFKKLFENE